MDRKIGEGYLARKQLFAEALRTGTVTVQQIEQALPAGALTPAERWLLYYSLRAAEVRIIDDRTGEVEQGGFGFDEKSVHV